MTVNKVLFVSGIDGDTRRYRCMHQQEQLALKGVATTLREDDDPQLLKDVFEYDLFILHRVPFSPLIDLVIELAHVQGKPVVFETDDLIFVPELEAHIGFLDTLAPEAACRFRSDLMRLEETFQRCDCILTTTEFLAQEARRRGKPVYVSRNAPSTEMFRLSEQAWVEKQQRVKEEDTASPVIIAYFSGTGSHNRDFQTIAEPLAEILAAYPQVWLHIGGQLNLGPAFDPFWGRIRRAPYITWRELPYIIAQADINLAPLEQENPFCQAKSEIKFVEAALVGVPTVASRVEAYEHAITHGNDGWLATTADEWRDALQTLLDHPDRRHDMGENARRSIYARYTPERRAEELWSILNAISRQFSVPAAGDDELRHVLVAGLGQYANAMQCQARQQEEQIKSLRQALRYFEDQLMERSAYLEGKIEAIMQGRVMRLMSAIQRYWRKISGKESE